MSAFDNERIVPEGGFAETAGMDARVSRDRVIHTVDQQLYAHDRQAAPVTNEVFEDELEPLSPYAAFAGNHKLSQIGFFAVSAYAGYKGTQMLLPEFIQAHPMLDTFGVTGGATLLKSMVFRSVFSFGSRSKNSF